MKPLFLGLTTKDWLLLSSLLYIAALTIYVISWEIRHK